MNDGEMNCLQAAQQQAVTRFLKTVVFFDDQAYDQAVNNDAGSQQATREEDGFGPDDDAGPPPSHAPASEDVPVNEPSATDHTLDAQQVTDSFSAEGILATVVQPDASAANKVKVAQIVSLSRAADIVVLDWQLINRNSALAQEAIKKIVKSDREQGGRLRLLVVFTVSSLPPVVSDLGRLLVGLKLEPDGDSGYAWKNGQTRVCVIRKPQCNDPHFGIASYRELPTRLIEEFAKQVDGLLAPVAMSSIACVREQAHRIICRFGSQTDGPYLVHRGMIEHPGDANRLIEGLLVAELQNSVQHGGVWDSVTKDRCQQWLGNRLAGKEFCEDLVAKFDSEPKFYCDILNVALGIHKKKTHEEYARQLSPGGSLESMDSMSLLCSYSRRVPSLAEHAAGLGRLPAANTVVLSIGTVVEMNGTYYLCLQPACDATRLLEKGKVANTRANFPFLSLENEPSNSEHDLPVITNKREVRFVTVPGRKITHSIRLFGFKPHSQDCPEVVAGERKTRGQSQLFFEGTPPDYRSAGSTGRESPLRFRWVGELRLEKALRIASTLAARLHTPGIDEFEWLRDRGANQEKKKEGEKREGQDKNGKKTAPK